MPTKKFTVDEFNEFELLDRYEEQYEHAMVYVSEVCKAHDGILYRFGYIRDYNEGPIDKCGGQLTELVGTEVIPVEVLKTEYKDKK